MTCIVGVSHKGQVYLGGDSAGVSGWDLTIRADQKVWSTGAWVYGFTSSFRMGQILRHRINPPPREAQALDAYMVTTFVDHVRDLLDKAGWLKTENGRIDGGTFLVGHAGRLFQISDDFQVGEPVDPFAAIGCGAQVALGALHATGTKSPEQRIGLALDAAERHSAGVRGPFHIATTAEVATTDKAGVS